MARYVLKDDQWINRETGEPLKVDPNWTPQAPHVWRDIPEYRSPIDGQLIGSRSARREDLKRNNCVEIDPPKRPRGYKNERFAKKHGLTLRTDND
jgi:hypothetical protein